MTDVDVVDQGRTWYKENWDPDMTVGEWYRLMHDSRWAYPTWPEEWGGRGLSIAVAKEVRAERRDAGALAPPSGIGASLLPPMLLRHGNDEQRDRFLRQLAYGEITMCQMLSEPDAGSDLAASRTSAVRDGDEWRIDGTKVWTSNVAIVDYGLLLARTDWDAPKHRGLSFFLCPAQQPAVEVQPIRQMNGRAEFNLVHFNSAVVSDRDRLGDAGDGWAVARTFLTYEKNSFNPSAHEGGPFHRVDRDQRAGDLQEWFTSGTATAARGNRGIARVVRSLAAATGRNEDADVRQDLARLHTYRAIMGYTNLRMRSSSIPGLEGPISKLMVSTITRLQRDLGLRLQGAHGMLLGPESRDEGFQEFALSSPAISIAGGTDEIQRNHLGEKVLGLPREPGTDNEGPFSRQGHGAAAWK